MRTEVSDYILFLVGVALGWYIRQVHNYVRSRVKGVEYKPTPVPLGLRITIFVVVAMTLAAVYLAVHEETDVEYEASVWLEVYRYLTSLVAWVILLAMGNWLRIYYLNPREHLSTGPLRWWYVLFLGVAVLIVAVAAGNLFAALNHLTFNPLNSLVLPSELLVLVGLYGLRTWMNDVVYGEEEDDVESEPREADPGGDSS